MIEKLIHKLLDMKNRNSSAREKATSSADDFISLKTKGHITAELYDKDGNVVHRHDQDNLIVKGATDIILRCLSGVADSRVWLVPHAGEYMWPRKIVRTYSANKYGIYYIHDFNPSTIGVIKKPSSKPRTLYKITYHDPREQAWYHQWYYDRYNELKAKRLAEYAVWQEYRWDIPPETNLPAGYVPPPPTNPTACPQPFSLDSTSDLYKYWTRRDVATVAVTDDTEVENIYCDYSPSFIAIGEGMTYDVNDDDKSITYSSGWVRHVSDDDEDPYWNCLYRSLRWSSDPSAQAQFTFKGTKLIIYRTLVEDGAMMGISIDGIDYPNIDCWNPASGTQCKVAVTVAEGLQDVVHTVVIRHTGQKNPGCTSSTPRITFEGYAADGLHTGLSRLYSELPTVTQAVKLPEFYNTTNDPPYTFTLTRLPIPGTEKIVAGGIQLTKAGVDSYGNPIAPVPGQYQINYSTGLVQLGEPAMKVAVTYTALEPFATMYSRAIVEKPRTGPDAPIYNFKDRKIVFQGEFPPGIPNYPVKITEMGLFDGSEDDEKAKMFSIVRLSQPLEKYTNLGLRVVWEITIQAEEA